MALMAITVEYYLLDIWLIPDVHILILVNIQRRSYVGKFVVKSGFPSNFLYNSIEYFLFIIL